MRNHLCVSILMGLYMGCLYSEFYGTLTNKYFHKKKTNGFNLNLLAPIEDAISKYKNHSSLNAIKGNISKLDNPNFHFEYVTLNQALEKLEKLDPKKASR